MAKILTVDDEQSICRAFAQFFKLEGHTALSASNAEDALALAAREGPDLVFLDVQLGGANGLEVLAELRRTRPGLKVVVMTAYGALDTAMQATRLGAFDYLGKPVELSQLRALLARALHAGGPAPAAPAPATAEEGEDALVGQSPAMQRIFRLMSLLTGNDLAVLVSGESGVGKELAARGIHRHGPRAGRPFLAVNCAAIPESLLESELFGHERGAFTGADSRRVGRFEAAGEGTLFLDEVGELPPSMQAKLLRVLQERSFERVGSHAPLPLRARLVAATNRDLAAEVEAGRFREDLYFRLKLATLHIPPLRERKEDIPLLARHFLARANRELGRAFEGLEPAALEVLARHDWPGNVRELEHALKRAALTAQGSWLSACDLEGAFSAKAGAADPLAELRRAAAPALRRALEAPGGEGPVFDRLVGLVEQALVEEALRLSGGNQVAASRLLGLNRTTLRKKQRPGPG